MGVIHFRKNPIQLTDHKLLTFGTCVNTSYCINGEETWFINYLDKNHSSTRQVHAGA